MEAGLNPNNPVSLLSFLPAALDAPLFTRLHAAAWARPPPTSMRRCWPGCTARAPPSHGVHVPCQQQAACHAKQLFAYPPPLASRAPQAAAGLACAACAAWGAYCRTQRLGRQQPALADARGSRVCRGAPPHAREPQVPAARAASCEGVSQAAPPCILMRKAWWCTVSAAPRLPHNRLCASAGPPASAACDQVTRGSIEGLR